LLLQDSHLFSAPGLPRRRFFYLVPKLHLGTPMSANLPLCTLIFMAFNFAIPTGYPQFLVGQTRNSNSVSQVFNLCRAG
jgi:hypothetical protein